MTDIHNHILYETDDGCENIEESIILLNKMKECGFDKVILTPHFIEYEEKNITEKDKKNKLKKLKTKIEDIDLSLGSEIYINDNISKYIKEKEINTLNNTKYILIELPLKNNLLNLCDMLYNLKIEGYIPIIAHPERYINFIENKNIIKELKEDGVLFQCNYGSILGKYGRNTKKRFKYMLKHKYIDILATDIHRDTKNNILDKFNIIERKIKRIAGKEYYNKIISNSDLIFEDKKINPNY